MTRTIKFTLNGAPVAAEVKPHHNLVEVLQRDFNLTGARESGAVGDGLELDTCSEFILSGASLHDHFAVVFSTASDMGGNEPAAVELGRPHSGSPRRPVWSV